MNSQKTAIQKVTNFQKKYRTLTPRDKFFEMVNLVPGQRLKHFSTTGVQSFSPDFDQASGFYSIELEFENGVKLKIATRNHDMFTRDFLIVEVTDENPNHKP